VVAADPRSISRRSRELRVVSIALVSVLVIGSLWSTALLIDDGELDGGGAAARVHDAPTHPDLAFPQQLKGSVTRHLPPPASHLGRRGRLSLTQPG
jgi:hypothetical protein